MIPHHPERRLSPLGRSPLCLNQWRINGLPSVLSRKILQDDIVEHRVGQQALEREGHAQRRGASVKVPLVQTHRRARSSARRQPVLLRRNTTAPSSADCLHSPPGPLIVSQDRRRAGLPINIFVSDTCTLPSRIPVRSHGSLKTGNPVIESYTTGSRWIETSDACPERRCAAGKRHAICIVAIPMPGSDPIPH